MIGTDEWRASDDFLMAFLARASSTPPTTEFELSLFRHHRYMALKEGVGW